MPLLTGTKRALFRQERAWSVQFYQENDGIDFGSGVNIDDLFTADCTIEFYVKASLTGGLIRILSKGPSVLTSGWIAYIQATGEIVFLAQFATNDVTMTGAYVADNHWRHIAVDWDVGTLTARLFVGGALSQTDVAVGAYQVDAASDCIVNGIQAIGTGDAAFSIGPIRLSNTRRYTGTSFSPPTMNHWPFNDANAQLITRMSDAAGTTATDYSGNSYDGTITFGANTRWYYGRV